ncbi:unnamed protein product [Prunus armeniaca]
MEDVYVEGVEKMDLFRLRRQKKKVNLAVHRQEVPLVNVFLEGMKCDPEVLARTPATSYADRAQKTFLTHAYAYGEMYVNMAKADKEIQRLKRRNEMAKDKIAEAQDAIREKNAMLLWWDVFGAEELRWEQRLARFNPSVEINFDTSGEPPSPSPSTDATPKPEPATMDTPSTKS